MPDAVAARLQTGIEILNLALSPSQVSALQAYLELLMQWNKAYNLSAIRDPLEAVDKHLLDSLAILPLIDPSKRYIDIGAGAGLPGIPLAIAQPEMNITLVDSNGKKTRFMRHAVMHLGLKNVTVIQSRVEQLDDTIEFDVVLARALATLSQLVHWLGSKFSAGKKMLALKGQFPKQELSELAPQFKVSAVTEIQVPGIIGARHVVEVLAPSNSGDARD